MGHPQRTDGLSVAAMIVGIVGIIISFYGVLPLLAVIFGGVGLSRTSKDPSLGGRGMAVTGLVLGIVGLAIAVVFILFVFSLLAAL